ncbi:unnamed protein product [Rhizoctonia solani]|uniref:Uncharacterized protein n=1 Tax=Rhizoctonia solani TaxID=456999 RepID=A0A8H3C2X1_9AGAM|nr:unnamed protein product [Rhizoctonia solani]
MSFTPKFLGPFPQEAREQHFLNPGRLLGANVSFPLNYTDIFPSHLGDSGLVYWKNSSILASFTKLESSTRENPNSVHYSITFPEIRWDSIRATEGWSGLQHHVLSQDFTPELSRAGRADKVLDRFRATHDHDSIRCRLG